jgi:hypothetical protein
MKRRKGLARTGGLKRSTIRRKPRATGWVKGAYRATQQEWVELRARKAGRCRVCGSLETTLHHLLGGVHRTDEEDNLVPLCGDGTTGCHGIYTSRMRGMCGDGATRTWNEVATKIRWSLSPRERRFIIERVGDAGLEKRYPSAA